MDDETRTAASGPAPDAVTCDAEPPAGDRAALPAAPPGYDLLDEIGAGGMGVVYRALDRAFDRHVAVKLLRDRPAGVSTAVRRFLDEARITGQLQHPGIPAAHMVGTLPDGRPYLVMKLIKGRTLDAYLRERPDPGSDRGRFLAAFEQVCHAVGYAHARGVIHRDLKPANVMVGAFNEVQVMDWGLAKVLGPRPEPPPDEAGDGPTTEIRPVRGADLATQAGSLMGTPAFMPPEQAVGAVDEVDARSDVFGLGAILCMILTGKPPYAGRTADATFVQAARANLGDADRRLDGCGADPELIALCRRCLAPGKADRPADGEAVARAVAGLRAAADERARQAEVARERAQVQAAEQRKRRRVQFALAVLVGLLICGGGAVVRWREQRAADEQHRRERDAEATDLLLGQCETALRAGDAMTAGLALTQAEQRGAEGDMGPLADRLARCRFDLDFLRELERIDAFRWTPTPAASSDYKYPETAAVSARWRLALADRGICAGETPPAAGADAVGRSLVRDRILSVLDQWLVREPSPWLRDLLHASDPDPYRDSVREAVAARDAARLATLAARPEALRQPARFAAGLGQEEDRAAVPVRRARQILGAALHDRPDDLILLMAMGGTYPTGDAYANPQRDGATDRVRWYQAAVAAHPRSVAARESLGVALLEAGDLDAAIAEYRAAVTLDPNLSPSHLALGLAFQLRVGLDEALAEYREAVRLNPADDESLGQIAWISAVGPPRLRNGKLAVESARRACELTGWGNPWRINSLAAAYAEVGEFDKAIETQKKAVAFTDWANQVHVRSLLDHEMRLYEQKKPFYDPLMMKNTSEGPGRAAENARDVIRRDPTSADGQYALGEALQAKKDVDGALAAYREAVRLDRQYAEAHAGIGAILEARHDLTGAVAAYREAARLHSVRADVYHHLAVLLTTGPAELRDPAAAVRYGTRACELTRWENAGCLVTLATACELTGDLDKAIEYERKAEGVEPGNVDVHARLASALEQKGKLAEAMAEFRRVVQLDSNSAIAHHHLAHLLLNGRPEDRDPDQALEHATRACELTRWENGGCLETLAEACARTGDLDKAIAYRKKALELPSLTAVQRDQIQKQLEEDNRQKAAPGRIFPGGPPLEAGPRPREVSGQRK